MFETFAVISNYTEIGQFKTLKEAKVFAVNESYKFDDVITITKYGVRTHMAAMGSLYSLKAI